MRTWGKIYGIAPSALLLPCQVVLLDDLSQLQFRTLGVLHVAAIALRVGLASHDALPGVSAGCRPALVGWGLFRIQPRGRKLEGLGDGGIPSGWAIAGDCLADCGRGSLPAKAGVSISPRLQKIACILALVVLPDGYTIAPELLLLPPILPALGVKPGRAAPWLEHLGGDQHNNGLAAGVIRSAHGFAVAIVPLVIAVCHFDFFHFLPLPACGLLCGGLFLVIV